eukprot:scaffold1146_cov339-Pavlova_lutheri.AAC.7
MHPNPASFPRPPWVTSAGTLRWSQDAAGVNRPAIPCPLASALPSCGAPEQNRDVLEGMLAHRRCQHNKFFGDENTRTARTKMLNHPSNHSRSRTFGDPRQRLHEVC